MSPREERIAALRELLRERILIVDGAMGTALQDRGLTAADFGGPELEGCNENLVRTRPDVILDIHRSYLEAGADILETNSFGGTRIVLAEYGLQEHVHEINTAAARLARKAADEFAAPGRPRFVAGSMGPTTKAISVTGGVTFAELAAAFRQQALGLLEGGADALLVETAQDTRNVKAALIGIQEAFEEEAKGWTVNRPRSHSIIMHDSEGEEDRVCYALKTMDGIIKARGYAALRIASMLMLRHHRVGGRLRDEYMASIPNPAGQRGWLEIVMLFDLETGELRALIPGGYIQVMRVGTSTAVLFSSCRLAAAARLCGSSGSKKHCGCVAKSSFMEPTAAAMSGTRQARIS